MASQSTTLTEVHIRPISSPPVAGLGYWSATRRFDNIAAEQLRPGLNIVDIACSEPRYFTLRVAFNNNAQEPLLVPLEPLGAGRYRKVVSLSGRISSVSLEQMPPGRREDLQAVTLRPLAWHEVAAMAWWSMRRHAASPRTFVAKLRQVAQGGTNLAFSTGAVGRMPEDATYRNWQIAFESADEAARLASALKTSFGNRPIEVLACVSGWPYSEEDLGVVLASLGVDPGVRVRVVADPPDKALQVANACARVPAFAHQLAGSRVEFSTEPLIDAIRNHAADLVVFVDRPGRFHPLAVPSLALELALSPSALAAYADHDYLDAEGHRYAPQFKPSWSPDYQDACHYVGQPVAFRAEPTIFFPDLCPPPDQNPVQSFLEAIWRRTDGNTAISHVPRVLFHAAEVPSTQPASPPGCQHRGIVPPSVRATSGSVSPEPAATRPRPRSATNKPRVTLIIPTKDNPELLAAACRSVREAEGVAADIVIVDNGATSQAQRTVLSEIAASDDAAVIPAHGPFNFSRLINTGRAAASGDVLVLLNDDVEALDRLWLQELVAQARREEIGAVGALLLYPDGRIQHAGITLGINGGAGHAFRFVSAAADGYGCRLKSVREVSAVTAACLAVRASVFDEVGGFSEDLPVTLNDVDFCLKVRERRYRNLFTPHARLIHRESTSRGLDVSPDQQRRLAEETSIFRQRWGDAALIDPYYSPHLSPSHEDFRPRAL